MNAEQDKKHLLHVSAGVTRLAVLCIAVTLWRKIFPICVCYHVRINSTLLFELLWPMTKITLVKWGSKVQILQNTWNHGIRNWRHWESNTKCDVTALTAIKTVSYPSVLCFLTAGSPSWSWEGCVGPSTPTAPSVGEGKKAKTKNTTNKCSPLIFSKSS